MDLAFLNPVLSHPGPWASGFVASAGPGQDAADAQELTARDVLGQLEQLGADEATRTAVYEELLRLAPDEPGRAVFAAGGEVRLTMPLRTAPPKPSAEWGAVPHLAPLLEHTGEDHRCLVAYVDRQGADFELRSPGHAESVGRMEGQDWPITRTPTSDPSEGHFHEAVENTWEQNAAEIAEQLARYVRETEADMILLVGEDRQRAAVHDKLPLALQPLTTQTDRGGRAAGAATQLLDEEIEELLAEHRRRQGVEALERFMAGRSPNTAEGVSAVEDVPGLLAAAREHRVQTLLLRPGGPDTNTEVWVGEEPDQLAMRRSETRYLGEPEPASARADDALLRAVAATGGTAVVLTEDDVRDVDGTGQDVPVGGLGAVLRWSHEEPAAAAG